MKRRAAWLFACLLAAFSLVAVLQPAYAAAGCRVDYTVTNQWSGGFGASVTIVNLGDPLNGWTLTFTFPNAGQRVSQGWNARKPSKFLSPLGKCPADAAGRAPPLP